MMFTPFFQSITRRSASHSAPRLPAALLVLTASLSACVGRVEFSPDSETTYGRAGERIFFLVGYNLGTMLGGSQDPTYQNITVKVGGVMATLEDVASVASTRLRGTTARVVVFYIPNLSPGRYPITVLQNGNPLAQPLGECFLVVLPK